MRLFYLFILPISLFCFQAFFVEKVMASTGVATVNCSIIDTLRVGSSGEQVKCLQKIVGTEADGRFGPLTKSSVLSFQLKYELVPDGIVGPLTREALKRVSLISSSGTFPEGCISTTGYSTKTGVKCDIYSKFSTTKVTETKTVSGAENAGPSRDIFFEQYLAATKKAALKGGLPSDKLPWLEEKLRKYDEENPDSVKKFFDSQKAFYEKKISKKILGIPLWTITKKTSPLFSQVFFTKKALAATGIPFGGFLTYVNSEICDCSYGVSQVFVSLTGGSPPTSNVLLDYMEGTQAFLNYNIPQEGIAVLGFYETGSSICEMYVGESCTPVESEGMIMSTVGSSAK